MVADDEPVPPSVDVRCRSMANNTARTRTTRRRTVTQIEETFIVYCGQIESTQRGGAKRTVLLREITRENLQQQEVANYRYRISDCFYGRYQAENGHRLLLTPAAPS